MRYDSLISNLANSPGTRREFLQRSGCGMGGMALASLLSNPAAASVDLSSGGSPMLPRQPHFPSKVKHVIHVFLNGGPSHVDTFDPKPKLAEYAGKTLPTENLRTERKTGAALPSPYKFRKYGQSGIEVSELFAHTAESIDDICVIRSMHADVPNHEPSLMLMNCGDARLVRPSLGSWTTYGLGTENQNLPGFVAMCPDGLPITGAQNWRSAFLPGVFQGTYLNTRQTQIEKLIENIRNDSVSREEQRRQIDLLQQLNRRHAELRDQESMLDARIHSFELAYNMQMEATDAFDIQQEPKHIQEAYGDGVHGRQLLIARRLVERGVRFVQLWHGAGQPWDNHDDLEVNHRRLAGELDKPLGALLKDLKQRGLLDETLVLWGGEFGRTPVVELPTPGANAGKINGRDHNHWGFTCWLAGGGVKGGTVYGATDEFGFQAVENKVHVHDLHATMLRLMGFDHERLTYRFAGRDFRLTDVHGRIIEDLIA
ncbi:MAG: DUF1501 domain-containing protein [Planctomycetaceae bacterium]|nr:DUF1501 domain-containing protein [Planctomycetaceae bacterium]